MPLVPFDKSYLDSFGELAVLIFLIMLLFVLWKHDFNDFKVEGVNIND